MTDSMITAFMPSGKPAPFVLTGEEAAEFLRLAADSGSRCLKYYRSSQGLVGFRLGRRIRYRLPDLLEFLEHKAGRLA